MAAVSRCILADIPSADITEGSGMWKTAELVTEEFVKAPGEAFIYVLWKCRFPNDPRSTLPILFGYFVADKRWQTAKLKPVVRNFWILLGTGIKRQDLPKSLFFDTQCGQKVLFVL